MLVQTTSDRIAIMARSFLPIPNWLLASTAKPLVLSDNALNDKTEIGHSEPMPSHLIYILNIQFREGHRQTCFPLCSQRYQWYEFTFIDAVIMTPRHNHFNCSSNANNCAKNRTLSPLFSPFHHTKLPKSTHLEDKNGSSTSSDLFRLAWISGWLAGSVYPDVSIYITPYK